MGAVVHLGDCRDILKTLPPQYVNCIVTSPPYFQLRDYGVDGQIGLEETPEEYISRLVEVFRLAWPVLRDDGTLWINIGDSYASIPESTDNQYKNGINTQADGKRCRIKGISKSKRNVSRYGGGNAVATNGLKPKDLIGIPWMLAFALRADGWYLRSEIIWNKSNAMPESVKDRPSKSHEQLFLLTKSRFYYYDYKAILEPLADSTLDDNRFINKEFSDKRPNRGYLGDPSGGTGTLQTNGRNKRDVWTTSVGHYSGAHYAAYPPALIEPCILAGCPKGGTVLDPFNGTGTTGEVALTWQRNYIGIEINPKDIKLSQKRFSLVQPIMVDERL